MSNLDGIKKKKETKKSKKTQHEGAFSFDFENELNIENPDFFFLDLLSQESAFVEKKVEKKTLSVQKLPSIKINKKAIKILIFLLISVILIFLAVGIHHTKALAKNLLNVSEEHISLSFEYIKNGDYEKAINEAEKAQESLKKLKLITQSWGQDIGFLQLIDNGNSSLVANERLLDSSYSIIQTVRSINSSFSDFSKDDREISNPVTQGNNYIFNISSKKEAINKTIKNEKENLIKNKCDLEKSKKYLSKGRQKIVEEAILALSKFLNYSDTIDEFVNSDLEWLSGSDGGTRKILILFQNNAELRGGSGGSLGSFGVANFSDGALVNIDFGINIYKIDKAFRQKEKIAVPDQLNWIAPENGYTLKDSGWAVDGPESFQKIIWFYEKETGEKVDGAFMIDTTAVASLLKAVGPIEMPKYEKIITDENLYKELEVEVHKNYFESDENLKENEPKKIIGDMMPIFIGKVFSSLSDKNESARVFASFSRSLRSKDITFYFKNSSFQKKMAEMNYSGGVKPAIGDYLYLNNSNIDGAKSSINLTENIRLKVMIDPNGMVSNELNYKRKHNGNGEWPDGLNKNFVRMLLPENSSVTLFEPRKGSFQLFNDKGYKNSNEKFWMTGEAGKSVINFWMTTKPQEESEVLINYKPNYKIDTSDDFSYIIDLQKQPGAMSGNFDLELIYPNGFTPMNVKNYDKINKIIRLNFSTNEDKVIKINFMKEQ